MAIKVGDNLMWKHGTGGLFTQNKHYPVVDVHGHTVTILDDDGDRYVTAGTSDNWRHFHSGDSPKPQKDTNDESSKAARIAGLTFSLIELSKIHKDADIQIRTDIALSIEAISELIVSIANEEEN